MLDGIGSTSWCEQPGCGRRWTYARDRLPCGDPAVFDVRDPTGAGGLMCAGHTHDARERITDVVITALPTWRRASG